MSFSKSKKQFIQDLQKMGIIVALGMMMIPAAVMARQVQVSTYRATCMNANVFDGKMHNIGWAEFETSSSDIYDLALKFCVQVCGPATNNVQDVRLISSYYYTESDSSGGSYGGSSGGNSNGSSREDCAVQNLSWQTGSRINPPDPECR